MDAPEVEALKVEMPQVEVTKVKKCQRLSKVEAPKVEVPEVERRPRWRQQRLRVAKGGSAGGQEAPKVEMC